MRGAMMLVALLLAACESHVVDPVMEEGGFLSMAAGAEHTCALAFGGSVWCWGSNRSGQLGSVLESTSATPVRARSSTRFVAVAAGGRHSCALDAEGRLYCWGANQRGQLGNLSRINQSEPVGIAPAMRFAHVSAGWFHTCALTRDGLVYCWGAAGQSQTGGIPGDDVLEPSLVSATPFATVSAGGFHTCALDLQGRAYCWGANHVGQLGDGGTTNSGVPRAVVGSAVYRSVASGFTHTCAVRDDLTPVCWGSSDYGEIGAGGVAAAGMAGATEPVPVYGGYRAVSIAAGYYTSCLIAENAWGWCWGRGDDGQLGTGSTWDSWTPQYVTAGIVAGTMTGVNIDFVMMDMGLQHACGLTSARVIFCWGRGPDGQLGAGPLKYSPLPVRVVPAR
jgi:alpha-tubulin suppressor-like RCC1 family protein